MNKPIGQAYPRVAAICDEIISTEQFPRVTVEDMLAVCKQESLCVGWFRKCCDPLYKANLKALQSEIAVTENAWLEVVQTKDEKLRGDIPKFRYEHVWLHLAMKFAKEHPMAMREMALFACSWGIGQKSGCYLVAHLQPEQRLPTLKAFMHDEKLQLLQVAKDLEVLLKISNEQRPLAFTRYNGGASAKHVSEYGSRVERLRQQIYDLRHHKEKS